MAEYSTYINYTKDNVSKQAPSSSGVYIIRVKLKNGDFRHIYVGQAKNLNERLLTHLQDSEPNACLKENVTKYTVSVCWVLLSSQKDRDDEEAAKIKLRNPSCNVRKPKVG